ncbi:hypothetical protein AVEN_254297-1 [Araneus ventricosus]|uniref:Uncharacterized protein n=1 Tax=Araneus ventricosus TaxID=182803 RepID=A0A4Y2FDL5_ARAVE|nr:hypothetical protein AVEN_254297-1 [Araneus ventricosus]
MGSTILSEFNPSGAARTNKCNFIQQPVSIPRYFTSYNLSASFTGDHPPQCTGFSHSEVKRDPRNRNRSPDHLERCPQSTRNKFLSVLTTATRGLLIPFLPPTPHKTQKCRKEMCFCVSSGHIIFSLARTQRESIVIVKKFELEILTNLHVLDLGMAANAKITGFRFFSPPV